MRWKVALIVGMLFAGYSGALAQTLQQMPASPTRRQTHLTAAQRQQVQRLQQRIHQVEQEAQGRILALQHRFSEDPDDEALQAEIAQIKKDAELQILQLRREIARITGDLWQLRNLNAAIQQWEHPGALLRAPKSGPRPVPPISR